MPATDLISTSELCRLAGCTYRQADYWARTGILPGAIPARGSGSRRGYSADDVAVARAVTALAALGAQGAALRRAAGSIRAAVEVGMTGERLFVDNGGRVSFAEAPAAGWTVVLDGTLP